MNLILFGFKGCGKTRFGRLLAQKIRRPFIDTDDLILELFAQRGKRLGTAKEIDQELGAQRGERRRTVKEIDQELGAQRGERRRTVKEIYQELGKEAFRALEREAILSLENIKDSVIALGGGAILDPQNVEFLLKLGAMVYLEAAPETLRKRVMKEELPAFLSEEDPMKSFLDMIHERKPLYESVPARRINTEILDEAGVLAALRSILILEEPPNGF